MTNPNTNSTSGAISNSIAQPMFDPPTKGSVQGREFKNSLQNVEDQLEKMSRIAGAKAGALASDVKESANQYYTTGRDYVKENPAKGAAIAVLAGAVAGSLLTLALRKRD